MDDIKKKLNPQNTKTKTKMKQIIINISILLACFTVNAQNSNVLKTIYAIGGAGTNINWPAIKIEEDNIIGGPGFFDNDCSQGIITIKASSSLGAQGSNSYGINNISDGNPMTAWVEGKTDYGIGESFEVKSVDINTIYNGYQSTPANWKNNSRVKKFKVYKDELPICYLILTDEMGAQHFDLPISKHYDWDNESDKWVNESVFKFEIIEVYKGLKWPDVAISEVDLVLCCFAENTVITSNHTLLSVSDLENSQTISTVDLENNKIEETEVVKMTSQIHVSLLKISTTTKSIEITQDHPMYVKDHGFISLTKLKSILNAKNYSDLIGSIELLTWNSETSSSEYEILTAIELINGKFQTYSIMELAKGSNFIANGFITKPYK